MKLTKEEVLAKGCNWQYDNVKEYADYLVYSKNYHVRYRVAECGNDTHRDILVNDEYCSVRFVVAECGNDNHRDFLVNDEDAKVQTAVKEYMGSTYYKVETNFGTYNGDLHLWVWADKYKIRSGCFNTDNLDKWFHKCESQLDTETATKYTKIMKDIIGGN